jgi:hypothetical protein
MLFSYKSIIITLFSSSRVSSQSLSPRVFGLFHSSGSCGGAGGGAGISSQGLSPWPITVPDPCKAFYDGEPWPAGIRLDNYREMFRHQNAASS